MVKRVRIVGTGSFLPDRIVTNDELAGRFGLQSDQVYALTGIRARHWADSEQAASDLAVVAAERAIQAAGVGAASIDAVLVSTTSPDSAFPSTACLVQRALGMRPVGAFDIAASCSGFLYGLSMAQALISSGQCRCCLVVAAEVKSKSLDLNDQQTALLFGDGAGAAVLVAEDRASHPPQGLLGVRVYADGSGYDLIRVPAGGSRRSSAAGTVATGQHLLRLQGAAVFRAAIRTLERALRDAMKEFGFAIEDVTHAIMHQANGRILDQLRRRLGMPAGVMCSVIEQYGNTSSASLPITLDWAVRERRIAAGDLILMGAFGGGLTWGVGAMRW